MSTKELNIGDYVRTKSGEITKIKSIDTNEYVKEVHVEDDVYTEYWGRKTTCLHIGTDWKSSPNIIDLLEVGDLIKLKDVKHYQEVNAIDDDKLYLTEYIYMSDLQKYKKEIEKDIEWVITHEQLNEAKYEVSK